MEQGRGFSRFMQRFGQLMSGILLAVLYFGLLGPVALLHRFLADPLRLRRSRTSHWVPWTQPRASLRFARRQD